MRNIFLLILVALFISLYLVNIQQMFIKQDKEHSQYNANDICDCIYIIEGKENARQPYGIEIITCSSEKECRQICINTVENNVIRFKNQTKEKDYLTFLAKRYCPPNWVIWLNNLRFYLDKIGDK
jgi:hypothetical protein